MAASSSAIAASAVLSSIRLTGEKAFTAYLFMDDDAVKSGFDSRMAPALSAVQGLNGAIAAFYPGVQERLYQMVGGDFYLVFTSISEVHIHPVNGWFKVSAMRSVLADTNRDMNKKGELLTQYH